MDAFYEPARKALLPQLVHRSQLPLAATIDSTVWSVVTTFATGLGGAIATTLGARMGVVNEARWSLLEVARWTGVGKDVVCVYNLMVSDNRSQHVLLH